MYTLLFTKSDIWRRRLEEVNDDGDGDGGIINYYKLNSRTKWNLILLLLLSSKNIILSVYIKIKI